MSVIHGKWRVEDVRKVILSLDEKTSLNGASTMILLRKRRSVECAVKCENPRP